MDANYELWAPLLSWIIEIPDGGFPQHAEGIETGTAQLVALWEARCGLPRTWTELPEPRRIEIDRALAAMQDKDWDQMGFAEQHQAEANNAQLYDAVLRCVAWLTRS